MSLSLCKECSRERNTGNIPAIWCRVFGAIRRQDAPIAQKSHTLPPELQRVIRSHARIAYAAMFSCAYSAIKKLARDPRFLGTDRIAMTAVLQTWGGQIQYHPHLHIIIPGGGLTEDGSAWLSSRQDLFVHTKPLAKIIRAKFRDAMKTAGLLELINPEVWKQEWVVDSQAVGSGEASLRYLARYVFRVAISNNRIVSYDNNQVTFQYKDSRQHRWRNMTLDAIEFIRRFLQSAFAHYEEVNYYLVLMLRRDLRHVLPAGFMKIRHYGFLNANFSSSLNTIRTLISAVCEIVHEKLGKPVLNLRKHPRCNSCGGILRWVFFCPPLRDVILTG